MTDTVLLVDDHPVLRQGLRVLLEKERFKVVGEAADGLEAIDVAGKVQPNFVVLDLAMPTLNGVSAVRGILKAAPGTKVVLLTMHTEEYQILEAFRAGVKGCVSKGQAAEHLIQALREVGAGRVYVSPTVSGAVVQAYLSKTDLRYDPLTDRERQVLQLIAESKTTKEVAVILGVSVKTAETHRAKLMEKLDIHSTAGLVRYAIRRGLVQV